MTATLLYGVTSRDPVVFVAMPIVLTVVALVARDTFNSAASGPIESHG